MLKLGIAAGLIGVVVWGSKSIQEAISKFKFDVVGYGRPTLSGMVITIPLQIKFKNPTPLPIAIDRLIVDAYIDKNGTFVPAAKLDGPVTIPPGDSTQWIMPAANLQSIFGGTFLNTVAAAQQIIQRKILTIRSDVTVTIKGVTLPQQSITNDVKL